MRVNYQSTGSGAGIKAFIAGQTDFGASDAAMTDDEIKEAKDNVILLPMTAGNIVLAYNLEGVTDLKLSRDAYAGIFLGTIKKWNDPKIAASNPGAKLPKVDISVVHRSDGSGTTFVFTQHLAAINEKWKAGPGVGKSVEWPVGVGGAKNDGVSAQIKQTPGAIGYIEYAFAASTKQPSAALENKAGKFVAPSLQGLGQRARGRGTARGHARLGDRPGRRRVLPDRHLHLDPRAQEVRRQGQERRVEERAQVEPDRRSEALREPVLRAVAGSGREQRAQGRRHDRVIAQSKSRALGDKPWQTSERSKLPQVLT